MSTPTETAPAKPPVMCKQCGLRECYLDRAEWATPVCFVCIQGTPQATQNIASGLAATRAALAALQAENAELRRGSAPCVDDDGTPFASARTWCKAYGEASDERDTARAEAATLGDRLAAVEADLAGEKSYCHRWKNEVRASEARATAAEGERDRLRELLCETADHLEAIVRAATLRFTPAGHTAALAKKIRTALPGQRT